MLPDRLKVLRADRKLTQAEFANHFAISGGTIAMWETGRRTPDIEMIKRIAKFFGVTIDWLMGKSQFRTQQELAECYDSWGYWGDESFSPAIHFCGLLKKIRVEHGISVDELAGVIGIEPELYEQCEEGYDPITQQQAEKLCEYLGTNIEQVLFDNNMLDEEIPLEEQDDVKGFLKRKQAAEDEAMREYYQNAPDDTDDEVLALIARKAKNLTPENRKKLLDMARLMFGEEFGDNGHTS